MSADNQQPGRIPPPDNTDRGSELVPQAKSNLLAFLRTNGNRFLGRAFAQGDEIEPVRKKLLGHNWHNGITIEEAIPLTHDGLHIAAFVIAHKRLLDLQDKGIITVEAGAISPTLVDDVIKAVAQEKDIDTALLEQLTSFADAFESQKETVREHYVTYTEDQKNKMMVQAREILPAAIRDILKPGKSFFGAPLILAAFMAIDEGFNDNGAANGAVLPPHDNPPSQSGATSDIPPFGGGDKTGARSEAELAEAGVRRGR